MSLPWQTVNVFVSSTFNDMHAERDYLVKRVFPELREWCEQRKLRLIDIDLRWGITEADATNKNVVKVCLEHIDKCRPFFLCFLGQRRGWVPEKSEIAPDTFNKYPDLKKYIGESSITEMEILHSVVDPLNNKERADRSFFYLRDPSYLDELPKKLKFIRNIYTNEGISDSYERKRADDQLQIWREHTIPATRRPVHNYSATWNSNESTPELALPLQCPSRETGNQNRWRNQWRQVGIDPPDFDLDDDTLIAQDARNKNREITKGRLGTFRSGERVLAEVILDDLKAAISTQFPEHLVIQSETPFQKELDQQEQFLELNCQGFIERKGDFDLINRYVASDSQDLFVITAQGGMGKTMFLANWIRSFQKEYESKRLIFYRFIGASDRSTTVDSLLRSLLEEIRDKGLFKEEIPLDPTELRNKLQEILATIGSNTKIVIVIDALNQLATGLQDIHWLPRKLPLGIQMIVSFKQDGEEAEKLAVQLQRDFPETFTSIRPFESKDDRKKLVSAYLDQYLKQLDEQLIDILIDSPGASNPLYLKVVLSEIRVYGSFENLGGKIRRDFGETPKEAFGGVLGRLEQDPAFTVLPMDHIVPLLFGLLSHARLGLAESELVDLFVHELSCKREDARDAIRLIIRQVRPFLASRGGRFDFFYESFKLAAMNRYDRSDNDRNQRKLEEWHQILADYFEQLPIWVSQEDLIPTLRRAAELPYHLAWAGKADHLTDLILAYELLETIVIGLGPFRAIEDLSRAISPPVPQENKNNLNRCESMRLIQGALQLSAHPLVKNPNELRSQLFGRLIRFEDESIKKMLNEAKDSAKDLWLRPIQPYMIAPGGALIRILIGHSDAVNCVILSPDGKKIASASGDKTIKIWDFESGEIINTLMGHTSAASSLIFNPDGKTLISGSWDQTIRVWDYVKGECKKVLKGHKSDITSIAISSDGTKLISGSSSGEVCVWDLVSGLCINKIKHLGGVSSVAFSPDSNVAVSGGIRDNLIRFWDLSSNNKCMKFLKGHTDKVVSFSLSTDGKMVVSASRDKTIRIWDATTGICTKVIKGNIDLNYTDRTFPEYKLGGRPDPESIITSQDNIMAITACWDKDIRVWDLSSSGCKKIFQGHSNMVTSVTLNHDKKIVVSGSRDKTIRVWNLDSENPLSDPKWHTDWVTSVATNSNGSLSVSGSWDKKIKVWDTMSGEYLQTFERNRIIPNEAISSVDFMPDCKTVISVSGGDIQIWDILMGSCLIEIKKLSWLLYPSYPTVITSCPDNKTGITGHYDGKILVWDLPSFKWRETLKGRHNLRIKSVAVSPDCSMVVSASVDNTLKIWDFVTGECKKTLTGHTNYILTVAITPDGRNAVSGSMDKTIRIWNLTSGMCTKVLNGHTDWVYSVKVSPDGKTAFSGSADRSIRVWDLESGKCLTSIHCDSDILSVSYSYPFRIITGDKGGRVGFLSVENIFPGIPIITSQQHEGTIIAHCLFCQGCFSVECESLGLELECPKCGKRLKINTSMMRELSSRKFRLANLRDIIQVNEIIIGSILAITFSLLIIYNFKSVVSILQFVFGFFLFITPLILIANARFHIISFILIIFIIIICITLYLFYYIDVVLGIIPAITIGMYIFFRCYSIERHHRKSVLSRVQ